VVEGDEHAERPSAKRHRNEQPRLGTRRAELLDRDLQVGSDVREPTGPARTQDGAGRRRSDRDPVADHGGFGGARRGDDGEFVALGEEDEERTRVDER